MGAGLYLTRHTDLLARTFTVATTYMPEAGQGSAAPDPYVHSMQWPRRFIGLKIFMSLAVAGWDGYAAVLRHQVAMGIELRACLQTAGWKILNDTPLPVVCFNDEDTDPPAIAAAVVTSGRAWISPVLTGLGTYALRACITNDRTSTQDLDALIDVLEEARASDHHTTIKTTPSV